MPILRLLQNGPFGPEEIGIMKNAHEEALRIAGITDRKTAAAEDIAWRVIGLFKTGERDPHLMAEKAAEKASDV